MKTPLTLYRIWIAVEIDGNRKEQELFVLERSRYRAAAFAKRLWRGWQVAGCRVYSRSINRPGLVSARDLYE